MRLARTPDSTWVAIVLTAVFSAVTGAFAAAEIRLACRLPGGTHKACDAVIGVETMMVCFAGLVVFALTVSGTGLILSPPFIIGGIMSARVVYGLTRPPAQQYFDANAAVGARPVTIDSPQGGSRAELRGCLGTI